MKVGELNCLYQKVDQGHVKKKLDQGCLPNTSLMREQNT
jgi:hypothetical protein